MLASPRLPNVYIDISWDEVAKYIVASPEAIARSASVINRYPDRFLFGTDEVAPRDPKSYLKVYELYAPLLAQRSPEAREKLLKGNYERLFDEARRRVRAWEKAHAASSGR
jgi:predicted TIM-barrel fold metal-dependent hydrolase